MKKGKGRRTIDHPIVPALVTHWKRPRAWHLSDKTQETGRILGSEFADGLAVDARVRRGDVGWTGIWARIQYAVCLHKHCGVSVATSKTCPRIRIAFGSLRNKRYPEYIVRFKSWDLRRKKQRNSAYRSRSTSWPIRHNAILCQGPETRRS